MRSVRAEAGAPPPLEKVGRSAHPFVGRLLDPAYHEAWLIPNEHLAAPSRRRAQRTQERLHDGRMGRSARAHLDAPQAPGARPRPDAHQPALGSRAADDDQVPDGRRDHARATGSCCRRWRWPPAPRRSSTPRTSFANSQVLGVAAQRAITEMRKDVEAHVMRLPIRYFDSTKTRRPDLAHHERRRRHPESRRHRPRAADRLDPDRRRSRWASCSTSTGS